MFELPPLFHGEIIMRNTSDVTNIRASAIACTPFLHLNASSAETGFLA